MGATFAASNEGMEAKFGESRNGRKKEGLTLKVRISRTVHKRYRSELKEQVYFKDLRNKVVQVVQSETVALSIEKRYVARVRVSTAAFGRHMYSVRATGARGPS